MIRDKTDYYKIFIFLIILFSYFIGFFLRENAAGGGEEFYELSWPIIQSFKENFIITLRNYGSFADYTIPFLHILNAYVNPFTDNVYHFQLFNTVVSLFIFFIFFLVLRNNFMNLKTVDVLMTSSIFLILPLYRTSAFWGKNENYGWLFLILALYFFSKIKKDVLKNEKKPNLNNILFFCFTSTCALYSRQALIFLPISYFLYLFFNNANKKIIITSSIAFFILAIPTLVLILFWGNTHGLTSTNHGFFSWWIHPRNVLKNVPILLSFFAFYLMPLLILELFYSGRKRFVKKYYKSFLYSFIFFMVLAQTGILDYLGQYDRAGGAVLKVNYLILKNNFLLLLLFSAIGFSIILRFFKEDKKNNLTFLIPLLIIYCFPNLLYQEYVEPLILIIFFLVLKTGLQKIYLKNISLSNFVLISYFSGFLIGSIYFKHIAFDSWEKWKIYLNII